MSTEVLEYIEKNRERFLEGLKEILKIESISTQPAKRGEVLRCAAAEVEKFKAIGLENVRLLETSGYPIVYGDWLHAAGKPTLLIYGHYDVQPPDPLDEWKTPPFLPTIRDGNIFARGADDNKGQHFTHLCAIEAYLKTLGKLPVNVKVVLEGDEEIGSMGIMKYVPQNAKIFSCDAILISDTAWIDAGHPSIVYTLRGLAYFEIRVKGPAQDIHSGMYGGMVCNPIQALSWILAKLKSEDGRILVPHFYDDVLEVSAAERQEAAALPINEKKFLEETGAPALVAEKGFTPLESNWMRPCMDICGVWGGYQEVGAKTIIPSKAGAKVSFRIVAKQDPQKLAKEFEEYVKAVAPKGVTVEVEFFKGAPAVHVDRDNFFLKQATAAYEKGFGKKFYFAREGASIPVSAVFQDVLKVPVIFAGLGLPDDRIHSPNEKFPLANFFGGIRSAALAYAAMGE